MNNSAIIIGIGGVTNGGKTTLSQRLQTHYKNIKVESLHMDNYYWDDLDPRHVPLPDFDGYADWDTLSSVDWERMVADVKSWFDRQGNEEGNHGKSILLVEGIMIYGNKSILRHFTKKYFFTLSKEECWERRRLRNYLPPEPEGYFDKIVWPHYEEFLRDARSQQGIVYLDGTQALESIFHLVRADIDSLLNVP